MGCFSASIWLFLVMMAAITLLVHAQPSQAGFISIDCGIASNSSYVDEVTNITYISDDQYIDTGSISKIDSNYEDYAYFQQFLNVRSFPTGERNCYTLPVVQYRRYLVRVMFMYGNYDGKNRANSVKPLQFELHLGVNLWDKINITSPSQFVELEALTLAAANFTSICLINTRNGDPFISAIELRPLKDGMYNVSYSNSDLNRIIRYNFGASADEQLRYPDDPFDRLWDAPPESAITTNVMIISTNQSVNNRDYYIEAPPAVLQTAITPTNATVLTFEFDSDSVDDQLYDMLYFAELEILTRNTTRTFDIYGDHVIYLSNFTPLYLLSNESYSSAPMSGSHRYKYSLNATSDSTFPPIINAFEVYAVILITEIPTHLNDVYAMNAIKKQYLVKKNWMGDPCSPSQYIWDGLQCAYGSNTSRITSLDLSSSGLVGAISSSFAELTNLTYLDLSNNNLTGAIPDTLGNMQLLKVLILSCNNLTGPLPDSLRQRSNDGQVIVRYDNTACGRNSSKGKISKLVIVVISVVSAVLLVLVVFIARRVRKVQDRGDRLQQRPEQVDYQIKPELKQFNYKELSHVTRNFESVIGEGGFGTVYHGTLHDGKQVAVKMLSLTSTQGLKEFFAEAQNLARIHHRNLVPLVGYCNEGKHLGLVYEYMSKGSLREHLKEIAGNRTLSWVERLRIAIESAQGLEYLHKGCNPPIIHRDVKTTNILLNNNMEAKLGDFGLSKIFNNDHRSHVSTEGLVGTPGYLDPEYQSSLLLNEKSDVYSFGVVLMELITGQSHLIPGPHENVHIAERVAQSIERGYIDDIVDKKLQGEYDTNSVWKIVDLSLKCTAPKGGQRPFMSEVVLQLKETLDLALASTTTSGKTENFDSVSYITPSAR